MKWVLAIVTLALVGGLCMTKVLEAKPAQANASTLLQVVPVPPSQADITTCQNVGTSGGTLGLDMSYKGTAPLKGYLVAVYEASNGQHTSVYETSSKVVGPHDQMIKPGSQWHSTVCGVDIASRLDSQHVVPVVDLLVFKDDSTAGPITLRESNHLFGVIEGLTFGSSRSQAKDAVRPTLVSGAIGNAIATSDVSLPMKLSASVEKDKSGESVITVSATNTGSVPIVGYEFKIVFLDPGTGRPVHSVTTKTLAISGKSEDYLLPGQTWQSVPRKVPASISGALDSFSVGVDLVVLADGTHLGPKHSREADELLGMIEGIMLAKPRQVS